MASTLNDKLEAFLRARPNEWHDGRRLSEIAGAYAWRSRCSDLRKRGLTIQNRQKRVRDHASNCPGLQAWDIPGACSCGRPVRYVVSEYRLVLCEPAQVGLFDEVVL